MPTPRKDETKSEFVTRCMQDIADEEDKKDWTKEHKLGFCYGLWKEHIKSSMDRFKLEVIRALYGLEEKDINGTKN